MRQKYSRLISYTFHPLLIPVYSLLLYFNISFIRQGSPKLLIMSLLCTIFFSVLIPLLSLNMLKAKGVISSVNIPKQEDRVIPYLICAAFLSVCSILLYYYGMFGFVYGSLYAGAVTLIVCALINFWWKISIHSAAMGCWMGCVLRIWTCIPFCYFAQNNMAVISLMFLLSGIVLSARIASGGNSQAQVYIGYALGFIIGYNMLSLFWV